MMDIPDHKPMPYINWTTPCVIKWMRGLDDVLDHYLSEFESKCVNGKWLNSVTPGELSRLGVVKVGHQMLLMEAIRLLQTQYATFDTETLQFVLFRLSRACICTTTAVNALHAITVRHEGRESDADCVYPGICEDIQDAVSYILNCVLVLTNTVSSVAFWLQRPPFSSLPALNELRDFIIQHVMVANHCASNAITSPGNNHFENLRIPVESVRFRVDEVIQSVNDSIMLTPCSIEFMHIKKMDGVDYGFEFRSTQNVHVIVSVLKNSSAFYSNKVMKGDELVEVNNQVVIGWQHSKVAALIRQDPKRLALRLRKRPAHTTDFSGFHGVARRNRIINPLTLGAYPRHLQYQQTKSNYIFSRNPRRPPLLPNNTQPLATVESCDGITGDMVDSTTILTETSSPIPSAILESTQPPYSPSYSSSSSPRSSMGLNDLLQLGPSYLDASSTTSSSSKMRTSSLGSSSFPTMRMTCSTPSTPLMTLRTKSRRMKDGEEEEEEDEDQAEEEEEELPLTGQVLRNFNQAILGRTRHKPETERDDLHSHSPSLLSVSLTYSTKHRRSVSGDPALLRSLSTEKPVDDDDDKPEPTFNESRPNSPHTPVIVNPLLKGKHTSLLNSMDDISRLRKIFSAPSRRGVQSPNACHGWLWIKKSQTHSIKYVKCWFTSKRGTLSYCRKPEDEFAEDSIPLNSATTIKLTANVTSKRFGFIIQNNDAHFSLASDTESDRAKWINTLTAIMHNPMWRNSREVLTGYDCCYLVNERVIMRDDDISQAPGLPVKIDSRTLMDIPTSPSMQKRWRWRRPSSSLTSRSCLRPTLPNMNLLSASAEREPYSSPIFPRSPGSPDMRSIQSLSNTDSNLQTSWFDKRTQIGHSPSVLTTMNFSETEEEEEEDEEYVDGKIVHSIDIPRSNGVTLIRRPGHQLSTNCPRSKSNIHITWSKSVSNITNASK